MRFLACLMLLALFWNLAMAQSVQHWDSGPSMRPPPSGPANALSALKARCALSDTQLAKEGLKKDGIWKVREFCSKAETEKYLILKYKFSGREPASSAKPAITGWHNSYTCQYGWSTATVPTYADLGLSPVACRWTDDSGPASCKVEGAVACLWGCSGEDPELGRLPRNFSSRKAMENYIFARGYHKVYQPWTSGYGYDYARQIGYGYRYQVIWSGGSARVEGPEPDPEPNWYGFINGFWPSLVQDWHKSC